MGKEREKRGFIAGRERDMNGGSLVVGQEGSKFIALLERERGGLLAGRQKEELIIVREREMEKERDGKSGGRNCKKRDRKRTGAYGKEALH